MTKKLETLLITSSYLVLGLFWVGHLNNLFQSIFWYDKLLHFIGGAWIGAIILYVYIKYKRNINLRTLIVLILLVGVGWEIFEFALVQYSMYMYGSSPNLQPSNLDTIGDIITNTVGAMFAFLIVKK